MKYREKRKELYVAFIVNEFERACERMGLKFNIEKSKVLVAQKDQGRSWEKVKVSGEEM